LREVHDVTHETEYKKLKTDYEKSSSLDVTVKASAKNYHDSELCVSAVVDIQQLI